jgi:iron-sulfur cluster assembly protein
MSATTAPTIGLSVTESAATEIKKFMSGEEDLPQTAGLRVRVVPGGCSGFQYSLNIEEQSREGDFIMDEKGVRMFIDMFSAQYLNDVENPNATGSCGCGSSFTA